LSAKYPLSRRPRGRRKPWTPARLKTNMPLVRARENLSLAQSGLNGAKATQAKAELAAADQIGRILNAKQQDRGHTEN
jgi:hypothetical protein